MASSLGAVLKLLCSKYFHGVLCGVFCLTARELGRERKNRVGGGGGDRPISAQSNSEKQNAENPTKKLAYKRTQAMVSDNICCAVNGEKRGKMKGCISSDRLS